MPSKTTAKDLVRAQAEEDFFYFMNIVNPSYLYGDIHEEVASFLTKKDASNRQLVLLPRGHLKSHIIATWCAWILTREPWATIVYLSAGEDLAKAQLYSIKGILLSPMYKKLWPEMINQREADRDQWSAYSFNIDHPARVARGIRDHSMIVKTVRSNFIGLHASHIVWDDVVVPNNAYTETGRTEVAKALSQCSSILNPGGTIKAVGTRYHPRDAYQDMLDAKYRIWDPTNREFVGEEQLWEVMEEIVEDSKDGTGTFLWPRTLSPKTGEWYGFNEQELEIIKADYQVKGQLPQFYAQYYNNPNEATEGTLDRSLFKYYDAKSIQVRNGAVYHNHRRLNLSVAMDVAWTDITESSSEKADYTAIAVTGMDSDGFVYILDLDRFKTNMFQKYYDAIMRLKQHWGFREIEVESNAGGKIIAKELTNIVRANGGTLLVKPAHTGNRRFGGKKLRQYILLNPRYETGGIFHRKGGLTPIYEEELLLDRPAHDDLLDAVGAAVENLTPPIAEKNRLTLNRQGNVITDVKFGGRIGRAS